MNIVLVVVSLGILYFLAHAFTAIFRRTKIPDVLLLMIVGLCLGPVSGIISPDRLGEVGPVFVTITLVIILFESGLQTSLGTVRKAWSRGVALTIVNFFATVLVVGVAAALFTDMTLLSSFMLGAILGGTTSAVVVPLLRQLNMNTESGVILILESALSDTLTIVVALALLHAHRDGTLNLGVTIGETLASFFIATLLGIGGATVWSTMLKLIRSLQNSMFATPAFVFVVFGVTEMLGYSGYMAALAFGLTIGNMDLIKSRFADVKRLRLHLTSASINDAEKTFFAEIVFLLKTFFFVYVGISIQLHNSWLIYTGLALTVLVFVIRVPVVWFSISRSTPVWDVSLMAVMVPKGLAAATLAYLPVQMGIPVGEDIQNIVYSVILFSIALTSLLVFLLNRTAFVKIYRRIFSGFGTTASTETGLSSLNK